MSCDVIIGDAIEKLRTLPPESVHCVVTSPPYFGLRDYDIDGQIGLEPTIAEYLRKLVDVFREIRRVLRSDGVLFVNMGDTYNGQNERAPSVLPNGQYSFRSGSGPKVRVAGLKAKDLIGMPWRLALALQDDGWYLRQDIIWCLSGGTYVYARTQNGDMPIMVRDLARLKPSTVQLWNGQKWTRLLGTSKSKRRGTELEIVLRSGERISCTPTHRFPTTRGLLEAQEIRAGDCLTSCRLPQPNNPKTSVIDEDAAWLAGLYVAEGSMSGDTIQIAGHAREISRWIRLGSIAAKYGGACTHSIKGNTMNIRLYGKVLVAIIRELVTGRTARDKGFAPVVWRHSDSFVSSMLNGYLSGDGAYSEERWRLGFTRNYNLERDLRTACARLGYTITLNPSSVLYKGKKRPTFRGEIRFERSGHHNEKDRNEVIEVRKARCREVYDLEVEDEPHVFALASGVLTHNSKKNPMPESVRDRCTKSHEYIFLLSKSEEYFFDIEAIKEKASGTAHTRGGGVNPKATKHGQNSRMRVDRDPRHAKKDTGVGWGRLSKLDPDNNQRDRNRIIGRSSKQNPSFSAAVNELVTHRNKRSVWTFATSPYREAHYSTFPVTLPDICIRAGTSEHGCCAVCGRPFARLIEAFDTGLTQKTANGWDIEERSHGSSHRDGRDGRTTERPIIATRTIGWESDCCPLFGGTVIPCVVLDPFGGSGTTGLAATKLGRNCILIDLDPKNIPLIEKRLRSAVPGTPKPRQRKLGAKEPVDSTSLVTKCGDRGHTVARI
jgi:DNA modification methylase